MRNTSMLFFFLSLGFASGLAAQGVPDVDYRLLATSKTSTMERELNEVAREGFVLVQAIGGTSEDEDQELVAILERDPTIATLEPYEYLVLATSRTGTMRDELNDAARRGFVFVAQTVFVTTFGGNEVVVIMERSPHSDAPICEYELLATTRTSTMQDELSEYSRKGFLVRGLSVSETAFGGNEVVVVTERCVTL